jgi:hypothetical protein
MIPQIARGVLLTAVFAAVPWASPVLADVLVLNDGKVVEGEVADKGETYEVKTQYGTLAIRKGDVKKFVKGSGVGTAEAAPRESTVPVPLSDVKPPAATELAPPLAPPSLNPATGQIPGPAPAASPGAPAPPPAEAQRRAEALVREIYKADYAKRGPKDMADLAARLIQQGHESKDDPAARFVLFREGRDLAAQAGDARLALQAVEAMAKHYAIDALAEKLSVLGKAEIAAKSPEAARSIAEHYLRLMDESEAAEQYEAALRAGSRAESAARTARDVALAAQIRDRVKSIQDAQREMATVSVHQRTLAANPDDPAANAAMGKFYCLTRGDWEKGLPMLGKGSDAALQALAVKDLAKPSNAAGMMALADAWWDAGEKQMGTARGPYFERAVHWYNAAATDAAGLSRAKIGMRLAAYDKLFPQRSASAAAKSLQGFGTVTRGGSGQPVVRVKTLKDGGPGSLREALSKGNRTIVFDVAGEIALDVRLEIGSPFVTLDGLSAPAPGITLKGGSLLISGETAHDVVVRGLRLREGGSLHVGRGAHDVVVDRVSVHGMRSLSVTSSAKNVTVCWSIFAEMGDHKKSYAAMVHGCSHVTFHHNLFSKGGSSTVAIYGGGEGEGEGEGKGEGKGKGEKKKSPVDNHQTIASAITLDFRNNVVCGWARSGIFIGSGAAANLVGNCFAAAGGDKDTAAVVWAKGVAPKLFAAGNVSADAGAKDPNGIGTEKAPFPAAPVSTTDARAAARDVLAGAGARPLDAADQELLRSVSAAGR